MQSSLMPCVVFTEPSSHTVHSLARSLVHIVQGEHPRSHPRRRRLPSTPPLRNDEEDHHHQLGRERARCRVAGAHG